MFKALPVLIATAAVLSIPPGNSGLSHQGQSQKQTSQTTPTSQEQVVKVTIATVGSFLGPPTDHYKVGDQIPVTITMTNPSSSAQYACISGDLYQNLPTLTKDGAPVPYMQWQSYERLNAQRNHVCEHENLPQTILLRPNEPKAADWFVLVDNATSTGAAAWYDPLPPGKYQLSIQRRLDCCDGPMVESNKVSFEVVP